MDKIDSAAITTQARHLLVISGGVSATFAAQLLISFMETVIIARLGADELAGATIALSIYVACFLFSLGVVTAVTPLAAAAYGKRDIERVRSLGQQGVIVGLAIAVPLMVALFCVAFVFASMSPESPRYGAAAEYLAGAAPGLPLWTTYVAIRCLSIATDRVHLMTIIMMAAIPVYGALAVMLTFGAGPIHPLGVFGSGLAYSLTALAILLFAIMLLKYTNQGPISSILTWKRGVLKNERSEILSLGLPFAFRILLREGVLPAATLIVAAFGSNVIAAHAVASRIGEIAGSIAFGISSAVNAQVGYMLGSNRHRHVNLPIVVGIGLALIAGLVVGTVVILLAKSISVLMLGHTDNVSIAMSVQVIPIVMLWFVVMTLQAPLSGALSAFKKAKYQLWSAALGSWVLGVPAAYVLSRLMSAPNVGVWIGLALGEFTITALFLWKVRALITDGHSYSTVP